MPQALATFLVSAGVSALAASVIATVVTIAVVVGLQAIFGPKRPKPSDGQQEVRAAVGSRRRHYGIVHTSGQLSFLESREGTLGKVVTLGTGKENTILEHRINDEPVTIGGDGTITTESFKGAVHVYIRSGDPDQASIAQLGAKFPEWSADHRQRGCAHVALVCDPVEQEDFSSVYSGRIPEYSQIRHGVGVYDPRKDSTMQIGTDAQGEPVYGVGPHRIEDESTREWDDNWALVTADYWAHADGYGGGYDNVNWANIAAEADICEEQVTEKGGAQIDRWRCWASYSLASEERRAVFTDMLKAADGFAWQDADAKLNLISGRWEEPDLTFTDDHILGLSATLGPKSRHRTSATKVLYTEASVGYREQESATFSDADADTDPGSDPQAVEAFYVPHHNQAVRIGKIIYNQLKGNRWHFEILLNLYGLNGLGRRFCRVATDTLGVDAYFKIDRMRLNLTRKPPTVEMSLAEVKPVDWLFDAAAEEGTLPVASTSVRGDGHVPSPTGLALSAVPIAFGGGTGVAIEASWDDPDRAGLTYEAQYRPSVGGAWQGMTVDRSNFSARSGPVDSGIQYEVRVRALTIGLRASEWTPVAIITPLASLSAPTALFASGDTGEATVSFRMPTENNLSYARLYRATSSNFGSAVQVGGDIVGGLGEVVTRTDSGLSAGTKYYWARAFDGAGEPSALAGPATAAVT